MKWRRPSADRVTPEPFREQADAYTRLSEEYTAEVLDLRKAAWRLSNAAESLMEHAKRADDPAHRSWFPAAIGDVEREIGLTRRVAGVDPFRADT